MTHRAMTIETEGASRRGEGSATVRQICLGSWHAHVFSLPLAWSTDGGHANVTPGVVGLGGCANEKGHAIGRRGPSSTHQV